MNHVILIASFKYQQNKFDLTVQLATWINTCLSEVLFKLNKFTTSMLKEDYEVSEVLISLVDELEKVDIPIKPTIAKYPDLLQKLMKENTVDYSRYDIMHEACKHGYIETVKLLISDGYEFGKTSSSLEKAVYYGHINIVKLLLEHKAWSKNVIAVAHNKHFEEIKLLLLSEASYKEVKKYLVNYVKENNLCAIKQLCKHDDIKILNKLLELSFDNSNIEITKLVLSKINKKMFIEACKKDNVEMIDILFKFRTYDKSKLKRYATSASMNEYLENDNYLSENES